MSRRVEGTVDEAATAWICGVFLYCMLCDQYPVRVRSTAASGLRSGRSLSVPTFFAPHLPVKYLVCLRVVMNKFISCWQLKCAHVMFDAVCDRAVGMLNKVWTAFTQFGDASNVRAVLDVRERMMKGDSRPTLPATAAR